MSNPDISQSVPSAPKGFLGLPSILGDRGDQSLDLIDLGNILRRRRSVIAACIALITIIGAATVLQLTPRYTATAAVLLDLRKTQVTDMQAVLSGLPADIATVRSEMEVLKSPQLAQTVVQKLDLTNVPEFNPSLRPPSLFAPVSEAVHSIIGLLSPLAGVKKTEIEPVDPAKATLLTATGILLGRFDVTNDGRSYVLRLSAESENPQLAAKIANAYADAYLDSQLEAKFDAVRRANDWLNSHLTELRQDVEASESAVQAYRAQHNLTDTNNGTLTQQQLAELNSQLILASADRAQKEASLAQIQGQLKSGGVAGASQVLASPTIQSLRQQETELMRQQAELATKYKPEHPAMINIKAQEADLEQKIRAEMDRVVQGMVGELAAARAKESSLRSSLQALQKAQAGQDETGVQLHELERQAESNRTLYGNFLNRFKETSAQEDIQQPDAHLIASAQIPGSPSYPRTGFVISLIFVVSILVGVIAAFGVERLDNGFRTGDQLEKIAHVTPLGLVPDTSAGEKPQDTVLSHPVSPYSEAIRTIRTALRYSDIDNPPKVVLVTSSLPDEGKSVFSISMARSVAYSGGRVLLIDCDLRRPSILNQLGGDEKNRGLLGLFDPNSDLKSAIQVDKPSGMHFISATAGTANPQDLLSSLQLRKILDAARQQYDLVILDSPPVLAVSDALILSHSADATMFLVRWGRTARPVVVGALKSFRQNGGRLAGVVLSRVDFRRHATYGYGDSGYYYGYYGKHYAAYDKPYGKA